METAKCPTTNEQRNQESSSYRHRREGGLSADDQNHPPIRADQILRSHRLFDKFGEFSDNRRLFDGVSTEMTQKLIGFPEFFGATPSDSNLCVANY